MLNNIERIIEYAYERRGVRMICKRGTVTGTEDNITVVINSEDPYIGVAFFDLLNEVKNEIEKLGYAKNSGNLCMDNYTITFSRSK